MNNKISTIKIIAAILKSISHLEVVENALWGIRIAVCASITASIIGLLKKSVKGKMGIILFLASVLVGIIFDISPIFTVLVAGIIGLTVNFKSLNKSE